MPNISAFDDLSPEEIAAIEGEMARRNFKRLYQLTDWCAERGWKIERGPIYNRAKAVKRRLEFVKASTEAMKQVAETAQDDGAQASSAVLALVQAETFEMMLKMQEAGEETDIGERLELLKSAALIAQRSGNTSIRVKQYQAEVRAKLDADLEAIKAAGGDPATLDAVQKRVAIYLPANNR